MSRRILCDAISFCYGPAAALSTLLDELLKRNSEGFEFDVLATGSTRELLERNNRRLTLLNIDSSDREALAEADVSKYRAFINVCNPLSYEALRSPDLPVAYVDFLLWMHEGPPPSYFEADLYLAEDYPGTAEWVQQRAGEISNLQVVPPLIRPAEYRSASGTLLVGLGGLISELTPLEAGLDYSRFIISRLAETLDGNRFDKALVACGKPVARALETEFSNSGISFVSMSHHGFLEELSSCEAFVSHPGLYAVFEAMLGGVPTALLPASNYTQVLQLRHYRRIGMAEHSFSWEDVGLNPIASGLPESEGVRQTIAQVSDARKQASAEIGLRDMLGTFFGLGQPALQDLGRRQQAITSGFGLNGPAIAAGTITEWLNSF